MWNSPIITKKWFLKELIEATGMEMMKVGNNIIMHINNCTFLSTESPVLI